jgi:hypothetical protein
MLSRRELTVSGILEIGQDVPGFQSIAVKTRRVIAARLLAEFS